MVHGAVAPHVLENGMNSNDETILSAQALRPLRAESDLKGLDQC
jgi:hypothetical protein